MTKVRRTVRKSARARRLIALFEERHGVHLGIRGVHLRAGRGADYSPEERIVRLGRELRGQAWREHLYHELAHALVQTYDLSIFKGIFTRMKRPLTALRARRKGFVSVYAAHDWEEDFAETFACFVMNDGRTRGCVVFEGQTLMLTHDLALQRKLRAVGRILRACQRQTNLA